MILFHAYFTGLCLLAVTFLKPCVGFHVRLQHHKLPSLTRSVLFASSSHSSQENYDIPIGTETTSRRDLLKTIGINSAVVAASLLVHEGYSIQPAFAFDGSGASASSGYNPVTKAEKKKKFQERIAEDAKDFNALGEAIERGETQGPEWVNFFILFQRREPDAVGRAYAALADLRGLPTKKKNEFEGGVGLLFANTFTKPGKPPDNTPAVKSFLQLSKSFDAIEAAGKAGDAASAKKGWLKTSELFSQYLSDVEMPGDLKDPLYN